MTKQARDISFEKSGLQEASLQVKDLYLCLMEGRTAPVDQATKEVVYLILSKALSGI
jgi:hypothetical protein